MRVAGSASWRISVDRWAQPFDWALWFRAAERIDVRPGGVVPGEPDVTPRPDPSAPAHEATELAEGWLAWWHALAEASAADRAGRPPDPTFSPPDFAGLADWPALRRVVTRRWSEANEWHSARKRAGVRAGAFRDSRTGRVVAGVERELGRKARPFSLELVLLPVHDDEVRRVRPARYLVSEAFHDGPRWPDVLRTLITPLA